MPLSYSYPGIYIQELPLSTHTITPAPTSITAFVGYTHPWKTATFNTAIQLFSFSDYETYFGGLYTSGLVNSDVAQAVYAFFLNGGNNAYVVGLQPEALVGAVSSGYFGNESDEFAFQAQIIPNTATPSVGMQFYALEPCDIVPMTATVTNLRNSTGATPAVYDTFDLIITYGTRIEVYRSVNITNLQGSAGSLDKLINNISTLVTVEPISGTSYGAPFLLCLSRATRTSRTRQLHTRHGGQLPHCAHRAPRGLHRILQSRGLHQRLPGQLFARQRRDLQPPAGSRRLRQHCALRRAILCRTQARLCHRRSAAAGHGVPEPEHSVAASHLHPHRRHSHQPERRHLLPVPEDHRSHQRPAHQRGAQRLRRGVFATTDSTRGVWKAPAGIGTPLLGTTGPVATGVMNDLQQGVLNLDSINCMRTFSNSTVVYGARTLVAGNQAFAQSKYVPVRRMTLFIEQTLVSNLTWVVFEPNDEPLWIAIVMTIEAFLLSLFNQGALQGSTPSQAFQVKCDSTTTTAADQQNGVVNIVVGVALLKPAEFVVITISQLAGQTS